VGAFEGTFDLQTERGTRASKTRRSANLWLAAPSGVTFQLGRLRRV
jgi:hypothetical protein